MTAAPPDEGAGEFPDEPEVLTEGGDEYAKPPAKPVLKSQIAVRDTREERGDGPEPIGEVGSQTLTRLIAFRPFMAYFCWLAHKQNPAAHRPETRVNNLRTRNPSFYWLCVLLDMLVITVAVAVLVAAATATLYKTIWL